MEQVGRVLQQLASPQPDCPTEGELQQAVAGLEDFLIQRILPTPFAAQDILESYAQREPSSLSSEDVDELLGLLEALDVNYRFFFANLSSSSWTVFLEQRGFFRQAVPTEEHEGRVLAPEWPELRYLERVASQAPEDAARVALKISRDRPENPMVHDALLGVAQALFAVDGKRAKKLLHEELEWIKEQTYLHYLLPEKLLEAGIAAAESNCFGAAVRVTRALLALEVSDDVGKMLSEDNWTRMDQWTFHEILRKLVEDLLPRLHRPSQLRFLIVLVDLLDLLVGREFEAGARDLVDDVFEMWRPAIEDHPQNDPNDLGSWIIEAIRDAAEHLEVEHGQTVLTLLEERGSPTLERIALFLREADPELDPDGTVALMISPDALRNITLRHELFQLLKSRFGVIGDTAQSAYFEFVDELSDPQEKQLYLWPVEEYLPPRWAEVYANLEEEFGALQHPDFPTYHEAVWVGPTSPYSTDEMLQMSPEELVSTLNQWEYKAEWRQPEPEGLARELADMVAKNPGVISAQVLAFEALEQPTYVRGIVQGLDEAVKAGQQIAWAPVLHLCEWVVEQPRGEGPEGSGLESFDATWGLARKQIARLMQHGTQLRSEEQIPFKHRDKVLAMLSELVADPNPTEEEEKSRSEYLDPSTIAINTTRGVALNALLSYAMWVAHHNRQETQSWDNFGLADVRDILDDRLASDSSPAVRSVFGKWFPYLYWLDENWTRASVGMILPQGEDDKTIWHGTWDAYLAFCTTLYLELPDVLRESYDRAVQGIGTEPCGLKRLCDVDKKLGGQLVTFYRAGALERDDPLFLGFFEQASSKLRYGVMVNAVRQLQEIPADRREAAAARLQDLWEWRRGVAANEKVVEYHELSAFSWWFLEDVFTPEWRLEQLLEAQQSRIKLELDGRVLEKLLELTPLYPSQVLGCLDAAVHNPMNTDRTWGIYDDHVKQILRIVLGMAESELRGRAEVLADYIGSLGFYSYRDLTSN